MKRVRAAANRLLGVFTRHRAEDDLREEFESHLEMQIEENVRRGMDPAEARRQALIASGGVTQAAEAVRDRRGLPWLEDLFADFRYALRTLRHNPGFSVVVVITLALAIGANTAIFSVVRGVLLKPLPHRDGDRLVYLRQSAEIPGGADLEFSVPEVRDLREGVRSLSGIAEFSPWTLVLHGDEGAERIDVGLVTGNYFEVMGLGPVLGRVTQPADDGPGVPAVMVLTHEFWTQRFGADPGIVGRRVRIDGGSATVIGVLRPAPFFPRQVDALLNMVVSDHHLSATMVEGRTHRMTEVVGRLAPGAALEQARAEVAAVQARMQSEFTEAYDPAAHYRIEVIPFREALGERARLTMWLLMGAALFVLVIAAANVANLTLMRGVRREQELVVRAALGAGVGRLRRLLLVENAVLALAGAVLGLAIAAGGLRLLIAFAARYSPRAAEIGLDRTVLGFGLSVAVLLAVTLSFVAALPREGTFASQIAAGARRLSESARSQRLQRGLVVVQVAVSVMLLAGAGLLTRTMLRLTEVDTGLTTEEVLTMQVPLVTPGELLSNPGADAVAKVRYEAIRQEIAALPGVVAVGVGSTMPLRRSPLLFDVKADGRPHLAGDAVPRAELRTAGPEFFGAAGIPILRGRSFTTADGPRLERVVIVNEAFAASLFPGEDAVGKRIAWTGETLKFAPISGEWRTIVGVARSTRDGGLDAEARPAVFAPFAQELAMTGGFAVRATRRVAELTPAIRQIIRRHAPEAPIENIMTIAEMKDQSVSPRRVNAGLVSSFGILAAIIAAVGIAGVLAFSVSSRTREIGIRMSVGADPRRVQRMILGEGGVLLAAGLALGALGALAAARLIRGLLFGVPPHDAVTFLAVAVVMAIIGLVACWIPAVRAARINPAVTMRA